MQFRVYGEDSDGNEDSVVVSGDSLEECIDNAHHEESKRGWTNCWSEQILEQP